MATTEQLKVKITADASQAKAEIGKFKNQLKGVTDTADGSSGKMSQLKSAIGSLKGSLKDGTASAAGLSASLGKVAVAAGAAVVAVKAMKTAIGNAVEVAATGDAIKDNAQKVFMSTTAYQEWGYVLKQNGIELSSLKTGMRQFSQQVATGSAALQKYGITATDVDTAFEQAIYTIQNMSTETEKIAAATELFGSRALELFPVLNLTNAETLNLMESYRALGGTMSNELVAASDACNDSITAMKAAWGGLRNLLATYLLPIITKVVQWITVLIAKIRIVLAAIFGVKETFGGGGKKSLPNTSKSIATNTGNTANNLKKAAKQAKELRRTLMGIDELSRLAEKATAAAAAASPSGGGGGGGSVDVGDTSGIESLISEETLDKIENFRKRVNEIKEGFGLIVSGVKDIFSGNWDEGLKKIKEGLEKIFPRITEFKEKWADLKDKVKDIVANVKAAIASKWADLKEKWNALISNFKDKIADMKAKVASKWSDLKDAWTKLMKKFKDKVVNIKMKFSTAVDDLKEWINNNVLSKINGALSKVPVIGSWCSQHPIRLAKGGVLTAPTAAVMGEYAGARNNPEIVTPQGIMYDTIQRANGDMVGAFAQMTRQVIAAIEDKDLAVSIGDEAIARSAQRGNMAYRNRTGRALLTI